MPCKDRRDNYKKIHYKAKNEECYSHVALFIICASFPFYSFYPSFMHTLPPLPYSYEALEPIIDAKTMEIHYSKHHQAYIDNLNKALADTNDAQTPLEALLSKISQFPAAVRNNAGGHWNHSFFWSIMTNTVQSAELKVQSTILMQAIDDSFGSYDNFVAEFSKAALGRFGSGWAWLILENTSS